MRQGTRHRQLGCSVLFVHILTLRETDFQPQLFHLQQRFCIATRIIEIKPSESGGPATLVDDATGAPLAKAAEVGMNENVTASTRPRPASTRLASRTRRWTAVSAGFVGVLLVIQPRPGEIDVWAWGRGGTSWLVDHIVIDGGPALTAEQMMLPAPR